MKSVGHTPLFQAFPHSNADYLLAHSSRIVAPWIPWGTFARRIGVTVDGNLGWTLAVQAYATPHVSSHGWTRYGLVVINWYDNASTSFDPIPVDATISFRGKQARFLPIPDIGG